MASIAGRTLLSRVIAMGQACLVLVPDCSLLVATDDPRIADEAERCGCQWAMTDPAIRSGSGRSLQAVQHLAQPPRYIVNLQGDAPFVGVEAVLEIVDALKKGASVATPVIQLGWPELDALRAHKVDAPFSGTTCVRGPGGRALWFSKAIIPALRDEAAMRTSSTMSPIFRHVGVYGYRIEVLREFEAAPESTLEKLEGLEQLRLLELGIDVKTVAITAPTIAMSGIDTPADIALAEEMIRQHGEPWA